MDDHVRGAIDRILEEVRAPLDVTLRGLAATVATEARAADVRFADAIRRMDEAPSLTDVLNVLSDCVGREANRGAVLIAAPGRLRGWRSSGFDGAAADAKAIELSSDAGGLLDTAMRTKTMMMSLASTAGAPTGDRPPFAQGAEGCDATAVPVVLGGTVAAVVYADAPVVGADSPAWVAAVDRLARYAGLVLEARTARYLTGAPLESPAHGVPSGNRGASGGFQ